WVVPVGSAAVFVLGLSVFLYRAFDAPEPPPPAAHIEAPVGTAPGGDQPDSAASAMRRGQQALALGDILGARAQFELAAQTGDASAALAAGKAYDPDFLPRHLAPGTQPDRTKAMAWYRQAAALGDPDA